jgi:hypothetical protein
MQPLAAEILTEQGIGDHRSAVRRRLRLGVSASSSSDVSMALILNISETGLLIETLLELVVGDTFQVEITNAIVTRARVIWIDGLSAGCEFASPVSIGAVSAAQLMSPVAQKAETPFRSNSRLEAEPQDYDECFCSDSNHHRHIANFGNGIAYLPRCGPPALTMSALRSERWWLKFKLLCTALALSSAAAAAQSRWAPVPPLKDPALLNIGFVCRWQRPCIDKQRAAMLTSLRYVKSHKPSAWKIQLCNRNASRNGTRKDWVGFNQCIRNPALSRKGRGR